MAKTDIVASLAQPLVEAEDAALYDVTMNAGKLVVAVTRAGGIDLDTLTDISRELSRRLDDEDVIGGSYTLEVTSPGLERTLRTPEHFAGAVGEDVTIKTKPGAEIEAMGDERRVRGTVEAADDTTVSIAVSDDGTPTGEVRTLPLAGIERARTVFTWGETGSQGSSKSKSKNTEKRADR